MTALSSEDMKGIIETLLFISEKPLTVDQIKDVLGGVQPREVKELIEGLTREHQQRQSGMIITEIAGGYQMLSNPRYAEAVRKFYRTRHKEKLSRPALETLAIIAYKQPVSRADIELIRGVNSDGVTAHLLEKELIKIVGRKDVPGRPYLYGTTKEFLEYFGLKSLENLPKMEDFSKLQDEMEGEAPASEPAQQPQDEQQSASEGQSRSQDEKPSLEESTQKE
jgi:segregation and condensation protein B